MKLNLDTIRDILLRVETEQTGPDWELSIGSGDYELFYTVSKLREAGLLKADDVPGTDPSDEYLVIRELTFSGHEFLEGIRDPRAWKVIKKGAASLGNSSFAAIMRLVEAYIATRLPGVFG